MALNMLTAPIADDPASFVAPNVAHIANLNINLGKPSRILGTNILAGAVFNVGGVVYVADGTTAITGTQGPMVKVTASGATASAAFTNTLGAGFAWNETYKEYLDTAGALYVMVRDDARRFPAFADGADPWGAKITDKNNWWLSEDTTGYNETSVTTGGTPTKCAGIVMPLPGKVWVRLGCNDNTSGSSNSYARIYVNGSAVGTQRTILTSSDATVYYDEEITVAVGDVVELYIWAGDITAVYFGVAGYIAREYIEAVEC